MSDYGLIINGNKVATEDSFPVLNPANEETVAHCPIATRDQLDDAVKAAADAFQSWSKVPDEERAAACGKWPAWGCRDLCCPNAATWQG